jgi:hypothetical protein
VNVLCREDLSDRRLVALLESSSDSLGNVIGSGELLCAFAITLSPFHLQVLRLLSAQLDKVTHKTTTSGAHRPPTFTVHDYNTTISAFQVTHKDKGCSLKMAHKCQNM